MASLSAVAQADRTQAQAHRIQSHHCSNPRARQAAIAIAIMIVRMSVNA
jgi:hypothetical protein